MSLRVPAGPPASRHVEHRVAGADANPYLVAALVLGAHAARHRATASIRARRSTGNGYEQAPRGDLPTHWHAALERAAESEFLAWALGAEFLEVFLAIKRRECEKFGALVSRSRLRVVSRHRRERCNISRRRDSRLRDGGALSQVNRPVCES